MLHWRNVVFSTVLVLFITGVGTVFGMGIVEEAIACASSGMWSTGGDP